MICVPRVGGFAFLSFFCELNCGEKLWFLEPTSCPRQLHRPVFNRRDPATHHLDVVTHMRLKTFAFYSISRVLQESLTGGSERQKLCFKGVFHKQTNKKGPYSLIESCGLL